jgi:hypothetical protein
MSIRIAVLLAVCAAGCVADPDESEAPVMMGEPEAMPGEPEAMPGEPEAMPGEPEAMPGEPEAMPGEPEAMPGEPEAMPGEPEAMPGEPEPAPAEHWLMTCFGIDVGIAEDLEPLIAADAIAQELVDRSAPTDAPDMPGMLSVHDARFSGRYGIQAGSHAELIVLRPDCTTIVGVDPGNNYAYAEVELDVGERLYIVTRRSRPEPTVRLVPPPLRPEVFEDAEDLRFHHAAAYLHPQTNEGDFVLGVEAQWHGQGLTFRIWDGDDLIELGHRYWSAGDTYWWETKVYLPEQPNLEYRFELVDANGETVDDVRVDMAPVPVKRDDEQCDPLGIRSICEAGLSCQGRICRAAQ